MNTSTRIVKFKNRNDKVLYGILHEGQDENSVGIILLSPGIKSRVAPHRMYAKWGKFLSEKGFSVLRFDPEGLGDSEGEIIEKYAADVYGKIQVGLYVNDTKTAVEWMINNCNIEKVVLSGLCGGAITGLLSGSDDKRVCGLIGLGIPVTLDGSNIDKKLQLTGKQLKGIKEKYFNKIFNPDAWKRFLSFKSDYSLIYKSLIGGSKKAPNLACDNKMEFINPLFKNAMNKILKHKKVMLAFGESDGLYWNFKEIFYDSYKEEYGQTKHFNNLEITIIKDGNHILSFKEWHDEYLVKVGRWLDKNIRNYYP